MHLATHLNWPSNLINLIALLGMWTNTAVDI